MEELQTTPAEPLLIGKVCVSPCKLWAALRKTAPSKYCKCGSQLVRLLLESKAVEGNIPINRKMLSEATWTVLETGEPVHCTGSHLCFSVPMLCCFIALANVGKVLTGISKGSFWSKHIVESRPLVVVLLHKRKEGKHWIKNPLQALSQGTGTVMPGAEVRSGLCPFHASHQLLHSTPTPGCTLPSTQLLVGTLPSSGYWGTL